MTARQRGTPAVAARQNNGPYNYARQGSADEREGLYSDAYGDRGYLSSRGGGVRDSHFEGPDFMSNQQGHRSRTDSNVSLPIEGVRITRSPMPSNSNESRGRGASMSSSPNHMYRDDNRPRSGHSNSATSRDKLYYGANDYQPPQFPQNPYAGSRHSIAVETQDRSSRPNSRTQSPVPPYPSTPPPQHRYDSLSPDQSRQRSNISRQMQDEQDQRTSEYPYQLAPLKFSPQSQAQESHNLLAGTPFDEFANSPETEHFKISPPAPRRPPPLPPSRHNNQSNHTKADHSRASMYNPALKERSQSSHETDIPVRNSSNRDSADDEWPLENVIEFLRQSGFGEPWQQAFRSADIHGEKFRACASFPEAKKLVHVPQEAHQPQHGRTLFKLITLIRKVLNPDSDTPDSETSTPARPIEVPRRVSLDHEKLPTRRDTAPATDARPLSSNINLPSPDSPDLPSLPGSARFTPRHNSEQLPPAGLPVGPPAPKLQAPPPPKNRSPQDIKRPMSPIVGDMRQQPQFQQSPFLVQYSNRHSKNFSTDSNLSDQSLRSTNPPARSSQDFQDILQRAVKDGAIVPQKRIDKKKSHEQMSKPGIFSRFFQRDKPKEVVADFVFTLYKRT